MDIKDVIDSAIEMSHESRAYIAERILESLDIGDGESLSAEWKKEISIRIAEIECAGVNLKDADMVFVNSYDKLS